MKPSDHEYLLVDGHVYRRVGPCDELREGSGYIATEDLGIGLTLEKG